MAQRSHVPKFGNWESEESVPYTAYFDKARKERTGSNIVNPNDPEENSGLVLDNSSSADLPPTKPIVKSNDQAGKGSRRSSHELQKNEDGDGGHGVGSTDTRRKSARQGTGSEYSIERSPLHRQAKTPGRDSPSWEGKNSYESIHGTPGRSRLGSANRGSETPDRGAAVPKFGEWDESDPTSAEGFTHIFNKVREEKQGAGQTPGMPSERSYVVRKQATDDKAQSCCFGWCK